MNEIVVITDYLSNGEKKKYLHVFFIKDGNGATALEQAEECWKVLELHYDAGTVHHTLKETIRADRRENTTSDDDVDVFLARIERIPAEDRRRFSQVLRRTELPFDPDDTN